MGRILGWIGLVLSLIFLSGCASVSVKESKQSKRVVRKLPPQIYVSEFSTLGAAFNVNRKGEELEEFKARQVSLLQAALVERLPELAPTKKTPKRLPSKGWLVRGKFVRVNQGSRALRAVVGFGAGATKMETEVQVFDLSRSHRIPFLSFKTTGGSNAEPGAIAGVGPLSWVTFVGLGASGLGNAIHGLTEDRQRTSREIRNHLVDYSIAKQLVPEEWAKKKRPKVQNPRLNK